MLAGKKIVVVEDSRTIKLQIKMILERENVTLVEVGTEWGLLTKIDEYGKIADLIIMDLVLNSEDGLDIIRKLKENSRYKDIPIIIITEKVDVTTILQAKDLGVKNYLKKPIKKAELISRINKVFEIQTDGNSMAVNTVEQ
jgi:DNA-binding response OmpR family regulator